MPEETFSKAAIAARVPDTTGVPPGRFLRTGTTPNSHNWGPISIQPEEISGAGDESQPIGIAEAGVTTAKLAELAVTTAKLAALAVTASKIAAQAVTTGKLADEAITAVKIAGEAIEEGHIKSGAVKTEHLGDLAVTAAKLADEVITNAKLTEALAAELVRFEGNPGDGRIVAGTIQALPEVLLDFETPSGVQFSGQFILLNLPTSDPGIVGQLWLDGGFIAVSAGL